MSKRLTMKLAPGLPTSVGDQLNSIRIQRRMTVDALAKIVGCNRPHLSNLLGGKAEMKVGMMLNVAKALGVTVMFDFPEDVEP